MSASNPQCRLDEAVGHLEIALAALDDLNTSPIAAAYIVHAIDVIRGSLAPEAIEAPASRTRLFGRTQLLGQQKAR